MLKAVYVDAGASGDGGREGAQCSRPSALRPMRRVKGRGARCQGPVL